MPKNMGQQTTNIQLFIAQIQSFAEGVSKTTKHKVLDLKQLKQSYSVVIQNKLLDIFRESHIWLELVSKELNHLAAILHVYAGGLNFMK